MKNKYRVCLVMLIAMLVISFKQKQDDAYSTKEHFDKSCNCIVRQTFYPDGKLFIYEELDTLNMNWNGYNISFYESGDTASFSYYKNGLQEGISFNKYTNGKVRMRSKYKDGNNVDTMRWYSEEGKLEEETIYGNKSRHYSIVNHYSENEELIYAEKYTGSTKPGIKIYNRALYDKVLFARQNITGKELFRQNCTSCHNVMKDATGPALRAAIVSRSDKWLRAWISNSAKLIASGDKDAVALYNKWGKTAMTAFPLPQKDMDKLIGYLRNPD